MALQALSATAFAEAERGATKLTEATSAAFASTLLYRELGLVAEEGLLESQIASMIREPDSSVESVVVVDSQGSILESNDLTVYSASEHELRDLTRLPVAVSTRRSLDAERFVVVTPMQIGSRGFGQVGALFSRRDQIRRVGRYAQVVILVTLLVFLAAIGTAVAVGRALARPIRELADLMRSVEAPRFEVASIDPRNDEIGDLAVSFSAMLGRLRDYERQAEQQRHELAQTERLATVGTFVAGLAHEVNNPLAGARTCLRRIKKTPDNVAQTAKYAGLMDEALARLERVVGNLLEFARPRREEDIQLVAIDWCAARAVEFAEIRAELRGVQFTTDLASGGAEVWGDGDGLVQLLTNLLINAIDAVEDGGRVEMVTGSDEDTVWVEVRDNGPGIAPENQDRIFEPFYTTKAVGKGTGLGLWVCKGLVTAHRGTLEALPSESGATFRVELPMADPEEDGE